MNLRPLSRVRMPTVEVARVRHRLERGQRRLRMVPIVGSVSMIAMAACIRRARTRTMPMVLCR